MRLPSARNTEHAIVRRGMAACLQQADFVVRGESAALSPEPAVNDLDVLVLGSVLPHDY